MTQSMTVSTVKQQGNIFKVLIEPITCFPWNDTGYGAGEE